MATAMTDPMNALKSFQKTLATGQISPQKADIYDDLLVLVDHPDGKTPRFTYALSKNQRVIAVAIFALVEPIDGFPCFNAGYAVDKSYRSQGYGKEVVRKAFDELTKGFKRANIPHLYVEAIISISNEHSKSLANTLFSGSPTECTDELSGEPALQYIRQLF
jgi:GNAT superfamily N-acetyltransferase